MPRYVVTGCPVHLESPKLLLQLLLLFFGVQKKIALLCPFYWIIRHKLILLLLRLKSLEIDIDITAIAIKDFHIHRYYYYFPLAKINREARVYLIDLRGFQPIEMHFGGHVIITKALRPTPMCILTNQSELFAAFDM